MNIPATWPGGDVAPEFALLDNWDVQVSADAGVLSLTEAVNRICIVEAPVELAPRVHLTVPAEMGAAELVLVLGFMTGAATRPVTFETSGRTIVMRRTA